MALCRSSIPTAWSLRCDWSRQGDIEPIQKPPSEDRNTNTGGCQWCWVALAMWFEPTALASLAWFTSLGSKNNTKKIRGNYVMQMKPSKNLLNTCTQILVCTTNTTFKTQPRTLTTAPELDQGTLAFQACIQWFLDTKKQPKAFI